MERNNLERRDGAGMRPWLGVLLVLLLAGVLLAALLIPDSAGRGITSGPDTTRVTWSTSRADTLKVRATFLSEGEPTTSKNGDPNDIYVRFPASSAYQRVGLVSWVESIPDSVLETVESATLTLYRLNGFDAPAADDTLVIAPVTVSWNEALATWVTRASGKSWMTPGGDVNLGYGLRYRAGDVPNLVGGAANAAVVFDVTEIVQAWKDGATTSVGGLHLAWKTGTDPIARFHDNAASAAYRPLLTIQSRTVTFGGQVGRGARGIAAPGSRRVGRIHR